MTGCGSQLKLWHEPCFHSTITSHTRVRLGAVLTADVEGSAPAQPWSSEDAAWRASGFCSWRNLCIYSAYRLKTPIQAAPALTHRSGADSELGRGASTESGAYDTGNDKIQVFENTIY